MPLLVTNWVSSGPLSGLAAAAAAFCSSVGPAHPAMPAARMMPAANAAKFVFMISLHEQDEVHAWIRTSLTTSGQSDGDTTHARVSAHHPFRWPGAFARNRIPHCVNK